MGVQAVRFWFGAADYAHDELERHAHGDEHEDHDDEHEDHAEDHAEHEAESDFEVGSRFTNREQEGRIEVQHLPTVTSLGELTGAIGVQYLHRKTRGQSFEGESLLEPAHTNLLAAFWFEELAVSQTLKFQAATRIEHTSVDAAAGRTSWKAMNTVFGLPPHTRESAALRRSAVASASCRSCPSTSLAG